MWAGFHGALVALADVPGASLLRLRPGGACLIETDLRFAEYRQWLIHEQVLRAGRDIVLATAQTGSADEQHQSSPNQA